MEQQDPYTFEPIGCLKSCFQTRNGTPRQAALAPSARATLKLTSRHLNNPAFSLEGLEGFSHVWLIFVFHLDSHAEAARGELAATNTVKSKIAPPRLDGEKLGLFATRSPHRPVPIGLSLVQLVGIEDDTLMFNGVDLVDGTPVLDVKPFIPTWDNPPSLEDACTPHIPSVLTPAWAESAVIFEHGLEVVLSVRAHKQLEDSFEQPGAEDCLLDTREKFLQVLSQLLAAEPRSRYRRDKCSDRLYFVELDGMHVTAWFDEQDNQEFAEVIRIRRKDAGK